MHASVILASALGAAVLAAPVFPDLNMDAAMPHDISIVTDYFNMLAQKVQESRLMSTAPVCDLSRAQLPKDSESHPRRPPKDIPRASPLTRPFPSVAPNSLPPPAEGFALKHVAVGRGTQNYTCDLANSTAVPKAVGAVATLFNASCVAATYPDLAKLLPRVAMRFNLTHPELPRMAPSNLAISGRHWFTAAGIPFFDLDTPAQSLGAAGCAKNASQPAPADAQPGQKGEPAVPWLKLTTKEGATGNLQEVFRVETVGGSAPASCKGMPAAFEVQYSAQYVPQRPPPTRGFLL